ncbi:MAG: hypothetical protein KDK63_01815, partial [Chlamydiia bacterium]|nr:hypothetical protein [Chlamydiia bacterium]
GWFGPNIYEKIKTATTIKEVFNWLNKGSPNYQPDAIKGSIDNEIYQMRVTVIRYLIDCKGFDALKEKGAQQRRKGNLKENVQIVLDAIVSIAELHGLRCRKYEKSERESLEFLKEIEKEAATKLGQQPLPTLLVSYPAKPLQGYEGEALREDPKAITAEEKGIRNKLTIYGKTLDVEKGKKVSQLVQTGLDEISRLDFVPKGVIKKVAKVNGFVGKVFSYLCSFSRKGIDLETRRYRSLFKGIKQNDRNLKVIIDNLAVIHDQIEEVDRKLVVISENQYRLGTALEAVAEHVDAMLREIMSKQALIHHDVLINRMIASTVLDKAIKNCRDAKDELERFNGYLRNYNRFVSYAAFQRFYQNEQDSLEEGLKGLKEVVLRPGDESDRAFVIPFQREDKEALFFTHYQDLWKASQAYIPFGGFLAFDYLLETYTTSDQMDGQSEIFQKRGAATQPPKWVLERLGHRGIDAIAALPYDVSKLLDYADSVRCFHYFYELFKGRIGGPLLSPEEFEGREYKPLGKRMVQDMLIRMQVGIMQANLISGFGLIPYLYREVTKDKLEKISQLLATNRILANNFMIYAFRKRIKENGRDLSDYWSAYSDARGPQSLQALVGSDWAFARDSSNTKWTVRFAEDIQPMDVPDPVNIHNGELDMHPRLAELHLMRKKLLRELAGYQGDPGSEKEMGKIWDAGLRLNSLVFRNAVAAQQEQSKL